MKKILILGSTGSIGQNALKVIEQHPDLYKVSCLVAGKDWQTLCQQAIAFRPEKIVILDETNISAIKTTLLRYDIEILSGQEAIYEVCLDSYDLVISAITGFAGLKPTINAIRNSRAVALANKESLVCAGTLIMEESKKYNCQVIPVDSEHSAIFQIFNTGNYSEISKIAITASGGMFRTWAQEQMADITPELAIKHPNWKMGAKITVDTATLMNKGFEVIEALILFTINPDQIEVLVHPESIVHGLVFYQDGAVLAQLALPDMQIPIAYSLAYPNRIPIKHQTLDLAAQKALNFEHPDYKRFPLLKLAQDAFKEGEYALIALNAANELAVDAFLNRRISFLDIAKVVSQIVDKARPENITGFDSVFAYNDYIIDLTNRILAYYD